MIKKEELVKITYLKCAENLYLFFLGLYNLFIPIKNSGLIEFSMINSLSLITDYSLILFSIILILSVRYTRKEIIILFCIFAILVPNTIFVGNLDYLRYFFIVIAIKGTDLKKLLKVVMVFTIVGTVVVLACSFLDVIPNLRFIRNNVYRYGLGFLHPLFLPNTFLHCTMIYIYIKKSMFSLKNFLVIMLLFLPVFIITNARMVSLILIPMCFLLLISHAVVKINKKSFIILLKIGILACFFFGFCMSIFFAKNFSHSSNFMVNLNYTVSSRLSMWNYYWNAYPVNLFGHHLDTNIILNGMSVYDQLYVLDNSFLSLLLARGTILTITILIYYFFIMKKLAEDCNYEALIVLGCLVVSGISANTLIGLDRNMFIYFGGLLLTKNQLSFNTPTIQVKR